MNERMAGLISPITAGSKPCFCLRLKLLSQQDFMLNKALDVPPQSVKYFNIAAIVVQPALSPKVVLGTIVVQEPDLSGFYPANLLLSLVSE
jgi:hypothetical protein